MDGFLSRSTLVKSKPHDNEGANWKGTKERRLKDSSSAFLDGIRCCTSRILRNSWRPVFFCAGFIWEPDSWCDPARRRALFTGAGRSGDPTFGACVRHGRINSHRRQCHDKTTTTITPSALLPSLPLLLLPSPSAISLSTHPLHPSSPAPPTHHPQSPSCSHHHHHHHTHTHPTPYGTAPRLASPRLALPRLESPPTTGPKFARSTNR